MVVATGVVMGTMVGPHGPRNSGHPSVVQTQGPWPGCGAFAQPIGYVLLSGFFILGHGLCLPCFWWLTLSWPPGLEAGHLVIEIWFCETLVPRFGGVLVTVV